MESRTLATAGEPKIAEGQSLESSVNGHVTNVQFSKANVLIEHLWQIEICNAVRNEDD
jgi:hypothetical protein